MIVYMALVAATYACSRQCRAASCRRRTSSKSDRFRPASDGATLDRTENVIKRISAIAMETPGVSHAIAFPGLSINGFTIGSNSGIVFAVLDDFEKRKTP